MQVLPSADSGERQGIAEQTVDRRKAERFPLTAIAELVDPGYQTKLSIRIADISVLGCYADTINVFPASTRVQLSIRHGGALFQSDAVVVYSLKGMGMGLRFANPPVAMENILKKWICEDGGAGFSAAPDPAVVRVTEREILGRLIGLMAKKGMLSESESQELFESVVVGQP